MVVVGKALIFVAMGVIVAKFIASLVGKGNVAWLNRLVTIILCLFISFELYQIGKLLIAKLP